jgi:hypothetical protein
VLLSGEDEMFVFGGAYNTAFGKMVMDPTTGHLRFTAQEIEAVGKVSAVESERAMSIGTGSAGGFRDPLRARPVDPAPADPQASNPRNTLETRNEKH